MGAVKSNPLSRALRLFIAVLFLATCIVACQQKSSTAVSGPVENRDASQLVRQGQYDPPGQGSGCCGETIHDPFDYFTYVDVQNTQLQGSLDSDLAAAMDAYLQPYVNESSPGEAYVYEITPSGGSVNVNPPEIHWRLIDYGAGLMPGDAEFHLDGNDLSEDMTVSYAVGLAYEDRVVMFYDFTYRPSELLLGGSHTMTLVVPDLCDIYGDDDGDGLPNPDEIDTDPDDPDTDDDGLTDCVDPCPTVADCDGDSIIDSEDDDIDGDGEPDPPLLCLGYGDGVSLNAAFTIEDVPFPQAVINGFPIVEAPPPPPELEATSPQSKEVEGFSTLSSMTYQQYLATEDRSHVQILLDGSIPPGYEPYVETPANWSITPQVQGLHVDSAAIQIDQIIDVGFSMALPAGQVYTLTNDLSDVGTLPMEVVVSAIGFLIGPPPCGCPSIATDQIDWSCCQDTIGKLIFTCGTCPFSLVTDFTVTFPGRRGDPSGSCHGGEPQVGTGDVWQFKLGEGSFMQILCPGTIVIPYPLSRCAQWDIVFTLQCYNWDGSPKGDPSTAEIHTLEPDINEPGVQFTWDIADPGEPGGSDCHVEMKVHATDECLDSPFYETYYYDEHEDYRVETYPRYWTECRQEDQTSVVCDEFCAYWREDPNRLCHVNCIEVTVYDKCGNWKQASMSGSALPKPSEVHMVTPPEGYCSENDIENPWKQYINLPKTSTSICGSQKTTPDEYGYWLICKSHVTGGGRSLPGVRVEWYQVDPWHRKCFTDVGPNGETVHNGYNTNAPGKPKPLWNGMSNNGPPVNCLDPDNWISDSDDLNDNEETSCFYSTCPWFFHLCTYRRTSTTDCNGDARVRFCPSSYGGDNHIIVADVCGRDHVDPSASQTVEVWRWAEVYETVMENNPDANVITCDYQVEYDMYPGPFDPNKSFIVSAFQDCFVEIHFIGPEDPKIDFQLQAGPNACVNFDEPSKWHDLEPMPYQFQLLGVDYSSDDSPDTICHAGTPAGKTCNCSSHCRCSDDHRHSEIYVGEVQDYATTHDDPPGTWPHLEFSLAETPVHELGHSIGNIQAGNHLAEVDCDPPGSGIADYIAKFGSQWAKSAMYYGWDHTAYYFSPYHICTIRGGITCEGWD